jgi:hypothetical protein
VDAEEHAIEVQLPFIQTVLPGAKVLPVLVRDLPLSACESLARSIAQALRGRRALLVASSDMSHYPSDEGARRADGEMLRIVSRFDAGRVLRLESELRGRGIPGLACSLCGASALAVVMMASKALGADRAAVLPYANSGEVSGDRSRVVGYGAALFLRPAATSNQGGASVDSENIHFTPAQRKALFRIARESIHAALAGERPPESGPLEGPLALPRGVFVTLTHDGRLRGCIGHFEPDLPLAEIVAQMAAAAATQDYRFAADPVTEAEMGKVDIKISILSPLRKIRSVEEIEVGKHGIWVRSGSRSGTYLPEVATELGWNREQFLTRCCEEKAGLAPDAWKKGADIYIYTSQVLSEK